MTILNTAELATIQLAPLLLDLRAIALEVLFILVNIDF